MAGEQDSGEARAGDADDAQWTPLRLGPFQLSEVVGRGGMGLVWAGRHEAAGLPVAVKVLTAHQFRRPRAREALANEVRAASVLCHPGIALLFDQGIVSEEVAAASEGRIPGGSPYVVMELVSGGTLGDHPPDRWGPLRRVLLELLSALAHAHARGLVHRDLKPSNVLVAAEGDLRSGVRLTDWGIARALAEDGGQDAGLGTVHYMAPEQILGRWREQGPWTDLYSLGCLAFRLAGGRKPVVGDGPTSVARAHVEGRLEPFDPWMPVPPGFQDWLKGLLAREPDARFQRAADAAHALLALGDPTGDFGPTTPPLEPFGLRALTRRETVPGFVSDRTPNALVDSSATSTFGIPALASDELPAVEEPVASERPAPAPLAADWRPEPGLPPLPLLAGAGLGLVGLRPPPLVGRVRLRDRLWRRLREVARTGRPGAVLLRGDPGCGKTRLADWLADRAEELGSAVSVRVAHSAGGGPGHGIRPALARALAVQGLTPEHASIPLEAWCRSRGATDREEAVALADLLVGDTLAPQRARFALYLRALRRMVARRSVVVRLDDLQWGDESLEFVEHVLADGTLPVLFVATWRIAGPDDEPDEHPGWAPLASNAQLESIQVPPLPAHEQEVLLDGLLRLEPRLREAVLERAAGMPQFAVELVADEVRRGRLEPGPEGWRLRAGEPELLPDGLHSLWMGRVERALQALPEDAGYVLEVAATLGQDVDDRELRTVASDTGLQPAPELVSTLRAHGLAEPTDHGFRLVHALLRESLLRSAEENGQLAGWHGRCADALHRLHGEDGGADERIGHHLRQAGRREASLRPLLKAAERRRERGEYDRALTLLDERDAAIAAIGGRPERTAEGQVVRARIAGNRGAFAQAGEICEALVAEARTGEWAQVEADAMRTAAFAWWQQGRYDEARALYAERCRASRPWATPSARAGVSSAWASPTTSPARWTTPRPDSSGPDRCSPKAARCAGWWTHWAGPGSSSAGGGTTPPPSTSSGTRWRPPRAGGSAPQRTRSATRWG